VKKILFAEDQLDYVQPTLDALCVVFGNDIDTTHVPDGDQCLDCLKTQSYDLFITDLDMPRSFLRENVRMTGDILVHAIRNGDFEHNIDVPILIVSDFAGATVPQQRRLFSLPRVTFIRKDELFDLFGLSRREHTVESRVSVFNDALVVLKILPSTPTAPQPDASVSISAPTS
jgi:CheY-like chemotaxis protein